MKTLTQLRREMANAKTSPHYSPNDMAVQRLEHDLLVAERKAKRTNEYKKAKHEALTSLGLVRVKGALGGTYYE